MRDMSVLRQRLEAIRREAGQINRVVLWFKPPKWVDGRLVDDGPVGVMALSRSMRAYPVTFCDGRQEAEAVAAWAMEYLAGRGDRHGEAARA